MVNAARLLAAANAANLEKRQGASDWSEVISTSWGFLPESTAITVQGYYTTTLVASGSVAVVSTIKETTWTTYTWATSPLLSPTPLDPACTRDLSAWNRNLTFVTRNPDEYRPVFQVGFDPTCLPEAWYTVDYYSPGICPSGYTIARDPTPISTRRDETALTCCYSSYTWDTDIGCVSYFNPILMQGTTAPAASATVTEGVTGWTVVVEYTSVAASTSIYATPVVGLGGFIASEPTTSTTQWSTTTGHQIVSGQEEAIVVGPSVPIRWASTDQAVLDWIAAQRGSTNITGPGANSTSPPDLSKDGDNDSLSGGAIAGIVIGALAALALIIAALLLCLRRRKQRAAATAYGGGAAEESNVYAETRQYAAPVNEPVYIEHVAPKTELDSRALSAEQYAAQTAVTPHVHEVKPYSPPGYGYAAVATEGSPDQSYVPYRPQSPLEADGIEVSPRITSIPGSTLAPSDGARSPAEISDQTARVDTDLSDFLIKDGPVAAGSRASTSQLERLKEEKARLQRLQEIAEQERRLEEQIERELAEERK